MAGGMIPVRIDPPAPVAPTPSFFTSGGRTLAGDIDWRSGVTWGLADQEGDVRAMDCDDLPEDHDTRAPVAFFPYMLEVPYGCDWVKPGEEAAFVERTAIALLEAKSAWLLSNALALGTVFSTTGLADVATDITGAGPVHPVTALDALLANYADCSQMGGAVVHVPVSVLGSLIANFAIRQQGDVYYGPEGSIISPGPGYPNPATPADPAIMYVSGPVEYALGTSHIKDPDPAGWYDRRTNQFNVWAQRMAIHRFETTCVFSVEAYQPSPADGVSV